MFVERLSKQQLFDFIITLEDYKNITDIFIVKEACFSGYIFCTVDFPVKPTKLSTHLTITATDTKFAYNKNKNWIKYLYSIFGEEYKLWYKEQQEKEFNELFANNNS